MEKRPRGGDGDGEENSPVVKRLKESLLEEDESNAEQRSDEDIATFMKTFEEEITNKPSTELGFLLEASDDELGLPPPFHATEPVRVESGSVPEFWDEPAGYDDDDFGRFGFDEPDDGGLCGAGEEDEGCYVAIDGLFDHSDAVFGSGEVLWKPGSETLPAQ